MPSKCPSPNDVKKKKDVFFSVISCHINALESENFSISTQKEKKITHRKIEIQIKFVRSTDLPTWKLTGRRELIQNLTLLDICCFSVFDSQ